MVWPTRMTWLYLGTLWRTAGVLLTLITALTMAWQEAAEGNGRFILANSSRECIPSWWGKHGGRNCRLAGHTASVVRGQEIESKQEIRLGSKISRPMPRKMLLLARLLVLLKVLQPSQTASSWGTSVQRRGPMRDTSCSNHNDRHSLGRDCGARCWDNRFVNCVTMSLFLPHLPKALSDWFNKKLDGQ